MQSRSIIVDRLDYVLVFIIGNQLQLAALNHMLAKIKEPLKIAIFYIDMVERLF